jgi:outer membrane protein assembly factor BamB
LRRLDGAVVADQALPHAAASTAVLGPGGALYFFAADTTPRLLGIGPNGAVVFDGRFTGLGGTPLGPTTPAIAADGRVFAHAYARLWAFASDGSSLWDVPCPGESPPIIAADGTVLTLTDQGSLRAVDPAGALRWEVTLDDESPYHRGAPALAPDGDVWTAGGVDLGGGQHGLRVTKRTLASGAVVESATQSIGISGANAGGGVIVDAAGVVYVHYAATYVVSSHGISAFAGGRLRWSVALGADRETQEFRAPAIAGDGRIMVSTPDQRLVAIGSRAIGAPCPTCTPSPGWPMTRGDSGRRARSTGTVSTTGVVETWPAVGPGGGADSAPVVAGGLVYHVADALRAIDPATGDVIWTVPLTGSVARGPAVAAGRTYVPDASGVHAVDDLGATLWTLPALAPPEVLLSPSGDLVFRHADHLYAVAASGAVRFGTYVGSSGGQAVADDGTLVACAGSDLIGLDATGLPRWSHALPFAGCEPTVDGDRVLVHGSDGVLRVIDRITGLERWVHPTGITVTRPVTVGASGTAYIAGVAGGELRVVAITPSNTVAWSYQEAVSLINDPQVAGAPAVDGAGTVVFNLGRNSCYSGVAYTCRALAVTAVIAGGARPWEVATGYAPIGSAGAPPALGADGTVYVAGGDGKLHAFR